MALALPHLRVLLAPGVRARVGVVASLLGSSFVAGWTPRPLNERVGDGSIVPVRRAPGLGNATGYLVLVYA